MRLKLITPPAVEPVTLGEAKLHARVDIADDDSLITSLIQAARRYCETAIKSALITQTWTLYQDGFPAAGGYYNPAIRQLWVANGGLPGGIAAFPGFAPNSTGVIDIPLPPLQSVASVQYYDTGGNLNTVDPATYIVSTGTPGRIQPAYSKVWPIARPTIDAVQITFTAGMGDDASAVPENIKAAIKMLVAGWYEHREWQTPTGNNFGLVPKTVDALLAIDDPGTYS